MIATFFGGSQNITISKEYSDSILIGELLAEKGYIVKSGGYYGLMEAVSFGAFNKGCKNVEGYTCSKFKYYKGNNYLTHNIICSDIYERLKHLIEESDLFIVQKGGIGTLSELFLTLDIIRKLTIKPRIILIGDFWFDIFNSLKVLIPENEIKLITIVKDYDEFKEII